MAMQHIVVFTQARHVEPDRDDPHAKTRVRRVKIGEVQCVSKEHAELVADTMRNRCNMDAEAAIKLWQPGGGSVTLDYIAVERLIDEFTKPTTNVKIA